MDTTITMIKLMNTVYPGKRSQMFLRLQQHLRQRPPEELRQPLLQEDHIFLEQQQQLGMSSYF